MSLSPSRFWSIFRQANEAALKAPVVDLIVRRGAL